MFHLYDKVKNDEVEDFIMDNENRIVETNIFGVSRTLYRTTTNIRVYI